MPAHFTDTRIGEHGQQSLDPFTQPTRSRSPTMQFSHQSSPRIPLHLLHPPSCIYAHVRHYSSHSQRGTEVHPQTTAEETDSLERGDASDYSSGFGFQSLKGLLYQPPPQSRYNRSRQFAASRASETVSDSTSGDLRSNEVGQESSVQPSLQHFTPSVSSGGLSSSPAFDPVDASEPVNGHLNIETKSQTGIAAQNIRNVATPKGVRMRKFPVTRDNWETPPKPLVLNGRPQRPWGVPYRTTDPEKLSSEPVPSSPPEQQPRVLARTNDQLKAAQAPSTEAALNVTSDAQALTHVNASGEARMVDVGAKSATKRTAIATAYVDFSNPEPFRLISENANKKGDVLGVSRIAGIMGAKRTADLIPLCHPIAISKVEVDVKLQPPKSKMPLQETRYGAVAIEALVECTGSTGVEMEALTAATVAAMTVFDMCKAVDRRINIRSSFVVYKSGGKSGLHFSKNWATKHGSEFFVERGLEVPDLSPAALRREGR